MQYLILSMVLFAIRVANKTRSRRLYACVSCAPVKGAATGIAVLIGVLSAAATEQPGKTFSVHPIGQIQKQDGRMVIVLDKKYQDGLLGLEQWSHVQVFWWFDKNDTPEHRAVLQVHPRGDKNKPLTGVFACRAPVRPNLIALSLCKIISVKDNVVEVDKIDAFESTPVLDLKPYAPGQDAASKVKVPKWAGPK